MSKPLGSFITFVSIVSFATACDSAFTGAGGDSTGDRSSGFRRGNSDNQGQNGFPNDGQQTGPTVDNPGTNTTGSVDPGSITFDNGTDTTNYLPGEILVHRRDGSPIAQFNHRKVTMKYSVVGSSRIEQGELPTATKLISVERMCPEGGDVTAEIIFVLDLGQEIKPNKKTNVGGPIGYRLNDRALLVGFEKEAVNNSQETSYHYNDDFVVEIRCPSATNRLMVKDLCIDMRIPDNGRDLITDFKFYQDDSFGRQCKGT